MTITGDKRKKLVLIQPYVGIFDTLTLNIPIGLLAVSRYIHRDYDVTIIDQRLKQWRRSLESALASGAICAGITCLTGEQIRFAVQLAKHVKEIAGGVPVVFGGIHPSVLPEQTLKEDYIDFAIIGEGEAAFKQLADALSDGSPFEHIKGLAYKTGANSIVVNERAGFLNLEELPELPFHLIDVEKYKGLSAQNRGNSFLVEGGRGCVHQCVFCFNATFNNSRWRPFPVENIIGQIEYLNEKHNITGFFIIDDSFFINIKRVYEFIESVKRRNLEIQWCCEANLGDLVKLSANDLKELEKSGLNWLSVGVESGSQEILEKLRKKIKIEDLLDFNGRIKKYDINVRYNFMTGYPWDDNETTGKTVDLCLKLTGESKRIMVQPLYISVPLPGTEYLAECAKRGFKTPDSLEGWADFDPFFILNRLPWAAGKKKKILEMLMYTSFFIDGKPVYHSNRSLRGRIIAFLGRIYRPAARFRFKNLYYRFFIEKYYFYISAHILRRRLRS